MERLKKSGRESIFLPASAEYLNMFNIQDKVSWCPKACSLPAWLPQAAEFQTPGCMGESQLALTPRPVGLSVHHLPALGLRFLTHPEGGVATSTCLSGAELLSVSVQTLVFQVVIRHEFGVFQVCSHTLGTPPHFLSCKGVSFL